MTTETATGRLQAHIEAFTQLRQFFKVSLSGELNARARVFQAGKSFSHIHWLVGHMAWVMDGVAGSTFGRPVAMAVETGQQFGMGATPDPQAEGYPALEDLMREFDAAVVQTIDALETMTDEDLDRPLPEDSPAKDRFPTLGALLHGMVFHTAYHLGQIALLRRAQGLPSGFGV